MSNGPVSRRSLLRGGAAAGALAVTAGMAHDAEARTIQGAVPWAPSDADAPTPVQAGPLLFFTEDEAAFIDAAVERLIPDDEHGPGARALGSTIFIDRQLAGSYGRAARWYMQGPWDKGSGTQGYQLRLTPAQLYRAAIKAIDEHCRAQFGGKRFAELSPDMQDGLLQQMEDGKLDLPGVDAQIFFEQLLQNNMEGFFADPLYGGNKDMQAWKMIGFPGARYDYRDWVKRHGEKYTLPPVAIYGRTGWQPKNA